MRTVHKIFFKELGELLTKYNAEIDSYEDNHVSHIEISFDYDQGHAVKFKDNLDYEDCSRIYNN